MINIDIIDWHIGLDKIGLTRAQMNYLNMGLAESKRNVDKLLAGGKITFSFNDKELAESFKQDVESLGAIAEMASNGTT